MTPSTYGWVITYDHLDHKRTWITGPRNIPDALTRRLREAAKAGRAHWQEFPDVEWFRLYDGDRELYYTGIRVGEADPDGSEDGFEPLDDYGTPAAGATEIRYLKNNPEHPLTDVWETL